MIFSYCFILCAYSYNIFCAYCAGLNEKHKWQKVFKPILVYTYMSLCLIYIPEGLHNFNGINFLFLSTPYFLIHFCMQKRDFHSSITLTTHKMFCVRGGEHSKSCAFCNFVILRSLKILPDNKNSLFSASNVVF